jgi:hypothetical protein
MLVWFLHTVAGPVIDAGLTGAVRIPVRQREELEPQAFEAVTHTLPLVMDVEGHFTVTVVVPCPLCIVAPEDTVQL